MTIVVFGSVNMDITAYVDRLPLPGQTIHANHYLTGLGGKGANQAAAAARLGGDTSFIGRVGDDQFGPTAVKLLGSFGVRTGFIRADKANPTGIAMIDVDAKGENFITVAGGANLAIDESDVEVSAHVLDNARLLLLQLEIPWKAAEAASLRVRRSGGRVILDPAPAPANANALQLDQVDILTPNERETESLTGTRPTDAASAPAAARKLHARGPAVVLLKLGENGAYLSAGEISAFIPAFKVNAIDSVAAGDSFNGGLAFALSQGRDICEAARFAAACGALSTTKYGAAAAAPTLDEVETLLRT